MAAAAGDAHPFPIYNARFRVIFPILDADGDLVTGATALDSEISQDQGTFADATNEATEIATSSGMYYLDLVAGEVDNKCAAIIVKTTSSGAKTTPMVLYPKRLPVMRTGTAQAGAASTITLDSGASALDDFYNGCYVNITNNSPANAQGQARRITDYVGSTKVATVEAIWGTNPSVASTFEVLLPGDVAQIAMWGGTEQATSVAGVPRIDLAYSAGTAVTSSAGRPEVNTSHAAGTAWNSGAIGAATLATDTITAAKIAADAIGASELAADAVAEIADAVWDEDATAHQTQGTFGQAIGDPVADTNTLFKAVVTDATGATVGVDVVALKAETVEILADTAVIGAAGAGLTALATQASVNTIDDFLDTEIAAILALLDDARGEPGQGAPPVNPDLATKIDYLYKAWRNKKTQTSTTLSLFADDATTVDQKVTVSDDGTTFTSGEVATGP